MCNITVYITCRVHFVHNKLYVMQLMEAIMVEFFFHSLLMCGFNAQQDCSESFHEYSKNEPVYC